MKSIGTPGWLIVETMGVDNGAQPTVVSQGSTKRNFASLIRKAGTNNPRALIQALAAATDTVRRTGEDVDHTVRLPGDTVATVHALPIVSGTDEVLGVQLWAGERRTEAPTPRTVGSFEFDFDTETTRHGPHIEREILGIDDGVDRHRVLAEVWKYFTHFDYEHDYIAFTQDVKTFAAEPAQPFAAEIELRGDDNKYRRVHMTVRARNRYDTERKIVGLVHDISDSPATRTGMSHEFARTAAQLVIDDNGSGVCQLDLSTGLMLDWIRPPEGRLGRWTVEVPTLDTESERALTRARSVLADGAARTMELDVKLRFGPQDWIAAEMVITAVGRADATSAGRVHQALLQVKEAPGIMIW